MNKKILALFVALAAITIIITPALAKRKSDIEVWAIFYDYPHTGTEDKLLITPNDKIFRDWGTDGTGIATLYGADGVTVLDTFTDTHDIYRLAKDSTTMGISDGTIVAKLKVVWQSNTLEDSGFTGCIQWSERRGKYSTSLKGVLQGFGEYKGQTLILRGWFHDQPSGQIRHEYYGTKIWD